MLCLPFRRTRQDRDRPRVQIPLGASYFVMTRNEHGYHCFTPETDFFESAHPVDRHGRVNDKVEEMREYMSRLSKAKRKYQQDKKDYSSFRHEAHVCTEFILEDAEMLDHYFDCFEGEAWLGSFFNELGQLYWRLEDDRFETEEKSDALLRMVNEILSNQHSRGSKDTINKMHTKITHSFLEVSSADVIDEFEEDLLEARDLAAMGYYSTTLFVIARAVEKATYILGVERNVSHIEFRKKSSQKDWEKTTAYERVEALDQIENPDKDGKILNNKDKGGITRLRDYRNDAAHKDYRSMDREKQKEKLTWRFIY